MPTRNSTVGWMRLGSLALPGMKKLVIGEWLPFPRGILRVSDNWLKFELGGFKIMPEFFSELERTDRHREISSLTRRFLLGNWKRISLRLLLAASLPFLLNGFSSTWLVYPLSGLRFFHKSLRFKTKFPFWRF